MRPTGKVALITGGAIRVGRAVALALAECGYDVALTCHRSVDEAGRVVSEIEKRRVRAHLIQVDLAREDSHEQIAEQMLGHFDRLDALINNASIFDPTPFGQVTHHDLSRHMAINARAPLMLIQRFAELLGARYDPADPATSGRVVNFIDTRVLGQPHKDFVAYSASKAALLEITRVGARHLAPRVTVNAVAPGVVAWPKGYTERQKARDLADVPMVRPGRPEDAAEAVTYLVTSAHYCTGQIIKVDGGRGLI